MAVSVDACGKSPLWMHLIESLRPFMSWLSMKQPVLGNSASLLSTLVTAALRGRRMLLKMRNARKGASLKYF